MSSISIPMVTFNVLGLDYCLEETVRCAMSFADEVCVNDGMSTDGTWSLLLSLQDEFGADRVKLHKHPWYHDNKWQEKERNLALRMCRGEWILFMDVDEVFHEEQAKKISILAEDSSLNFVSFPYYHFYGKKDRVRKGYPHWYDRHTKMGRRSTGIKIKNMMGDESFDFEHEKLGTRKLACVSEIVASVKGIETAMHQYKGLDIYHSDIYVYHYSWMRDASAQAVKRKKYNSWYANDSRYFDGYLPDKNECSYAYDMEVALTPFEGSHPNIMKKWLSKERSLIWHPTME
jgi:glycosyltransferase involved in cell wall biosynthesis